MRMRTLQAKKVRGCIYLSPSNIWKIRNWRGYQRPKTQILNFAIKYLRENEQVRKTVITQECLLSRKKQRATQTTVLPPDDLCMKIPLVKQSY